MKTIEWRQRKPKGWKIRDLVRSSLVELLDVLTVNETCLPPPSPLPLAYVRLDNFFFRLWGYIFWWNIKFILDIVHDEPLLFSSIESYFLLMRLFRRGKLIKLLEVGIIIRLLLNYLSSIILTLIGGEEGSNLDNRDLWEIPTPVSRVIKLVTTLGR